MQKSFLKNWRDNMPEPLKHAFAPVLRNYLTHNSIFLNTYNDLINREQLTAAAVQQVQMNLLKKILVHSYENVPYYKDIFNQVAFDPYRFSSFRQLESIPFLTREIIRENFDKLVSTKKVKGGYYTGATGGSSGEPLTFLLDYHSTYKENAFIYYNRRGLGYRFEDKMATFREVHYDGKIWKYSPMQNEVLFSPLKLSGVTLEKYVNKINAFNPRYLNGYLSSIWYFAKLLEAYKIKLKADLKGVFFMSENIDAKQRQFIEEFFKVKSFTHYGHSERCILAREISLNQYVFDPYYGYAEQIPEGQGQYSIVGTGFLNYIMPLIRYKTDDLCSPSGQGFFIDGKRNSTIGLYGRNNEFLSASAFDLEDDVYKNIMRYQFIQKEKGKADLLLIVGKDFSPSELEPIKKTIDLKTRGVMDFNIKIVDNLLLTGRGKCQMYISALTEQNRHKTQEEQ
jgi:phenylacetate-CoA ligase